MKWRAFAFVTGLAVAAVVLSNLSTAAAAQSDPPSPSAAADISKRVAQTVPSGRGDGAAAEWRDDADRILNMRRLLDSDRKQKAKLEAGLQELEIEFEEAAAEFEQFDVELSNAQAKLEAATEPEKQARWQEMVERLSAARSTKRARFELVIDRRRAMQQQVATLAEKLLLEEEYLKRLMSVAPLSGPAGAPAAPSSAPSSAPGASEGAKSSPGSGVVIVPGVPPIQINTPEVQKDEAEPDRLDEELKGARRERQEKVAALQEAETRVARVERAIEVFERDLASTRQLLELENRAAKDEDEMLRVMNEALEARRKEGEMEENLAWMVAERDEAQMRSAAAHEEVQAQAERIAKSEATVARLKKSRDEAVQSVAEGEAALRSTERRVWFLSSPIAPYRLSWWFTNKGPRVIVTLLGAFVLYWIAKRVAGKSLGKVLQRSGRGDAAAREGRAETLRRVFDSTAGVVIVVLGILTALNQAGVNVTVLLGGAAVIGAAIAFGSQNLIKDYFSGFMILMENQYSVGNVVKVGAVTGTVENITLRMTSLRDLEGVLHFIPHSQVLSVSNLTYGWSRIVMDIKIHASEDPDKVMGVVMDVARQLKKDPQFGSQILDEPEMLGVDQIGGAAMVIKLLVKTKPLHRWPVKREMLRRIKKAFDANGVKMA